MAEWWAALIGTSLRRSDRHKWRSIPSLLTINMGAAPPWRVALYLWSPAIGSVGWRPANGWVAAQACESHASQGAITDVIIGCSAAAGGATDVPAAINPKGYVAAAAPAADASQGTGAGVIEGSAAADATGVPASQGAGAGVMGGPAAADATGGPAGQGTGAGAIERSASLEFMAARHRPPARPSVRPPVCRPGARAPVHPPARPPARPVSPAPAGAGPERTTGSGATPRPAGG